MAEELVEGEDGWHWKRADTWHIPLSLHEAVELRLTRLSADARRVLQLAAVAGRRFDFALLQEITQYDEAYLMELMKEVDGRPTGHRGVGGAVCLPPRAHPAGDRLQDCWRGSDARCIAPLPRRSSSCMHQPWMLILPTWRITVPKRNCGARPWSTRSCAAEQAQSSLRAACRRRTVDARDASSRAARAGGASDLLSGAWASL